MFSPLANAGTVGASLISVGSLFQSRIARGKNEFMWCFVFEWGMRNLFTIKDRTPLGALSEPLGSGNGATAIGVHLSFCSFSNITSVSIV